MEFEAKSGVEPNIHMLRASCLKLEINEFGCYEAALAAQARGVLGSTPCVKPNIHYLALSRNPLWCLKSPQKLIQGQQIIHCKKVLVTSTVFWLPQLHSFCVHDTKFKECLEFEVCS